MNHSSNLNIGVVVGGRSTRRADKKIIRIKGIKYEN